MGCSASLDPELTAMSGPFRGFCCICGQNSLRSAAEALKGTLVSDGKRLEIRHFCFAACRSSIRQEVFAGPKSLDAPEPKIESQHYKFFKIKLLRFFLTIYATCVIDYAICVNCLTPCFPRPAGKSWRQCSSSPRRHGTSRNSRVECASRRRACNGNCRTSPRRGYLGTTAKGG